MPNSPDYIREWRALHPEYARWASLKWRYRLTRAQIEEMLRKQDGRCAACRTVLTRWFVDHDHACCPSARRTRTCGKCVRALLCPRCNTILGLANDSTETLSALLSYLAR